MDFLSSLSHLWPDFSAISAGTPASIAAVIWIILTTGLVISAALLSWLSACSWFRTRALDQMLRDQRPDNVAANRNELRERAKSNKSGRIRDLWLEFDESLVSSADQRTLFNTLDAEHFFNGRSLASGLTGNRFLAAVPGMLVAIGVLGTFAGLTIGLVDLKAASGDVDAITQGIDQLIAGASIAFLTSVWGVLYSLTLNLFEKIAESWALRRVNGLQHRIDTLYPRMPAEQSLLQIADHTREGTSALQELHERIGDRLQETVRGMSEAMQQALTDTLNNIMKPAIDALVVNTQQQSNETLKSMISEFTEALGAAGRQQGSLMQQAAASVQVAVASMTDQVIAIKQSMAEQRGNQQQLLDEQSKRFDVLLQRLGAQADAREQTLQQRFGQLVADLGQAVESQLSAAREREEERENRRQELFDTRLEVMDEQHRELAQALARGVQAAQQHHLALVEQHTKVMEGLREAAASVSQSSQHLTTSSSQLGLLSTHLRTATDTFGQRLEALSDSIDGAARGHLEVSSQIQQQLAQLERLQQTLLAAASSSEQAARLSADGFKALESHQKAFLADLRLETERLGTTLAGQVRELERQADAWFKKYSDEVRTQLKDRMDTWNTASQGYANQMMRIAQAIQGIVDELEPRK